MTRYHRVAVTTETAVEDELFLVAPHSTDIFHLDPLAAAIWRALAEPMRHEELAELFRAAFPDVPATMLQADVDAALKRLSDGGLLLALDD